MIRRLVPLVSAAALATAATAAVPAATGAPPTKAKVKVLDFRFSPKRIALRCANKRTCGAKATWSWAKSNIAAHNVHLKVAPKGVKHVKAGGPKGTPIVHRRPYTYTFRKAGTYRFVCDVHSNMTLKITVAKR